jgi:hypothetical protein
MEHRETGGPQSPATFTVLQAILAHPVSPHSLTSALHMQTPNSSAVGLAPRESTWKGSFPP